MKAVAQPVSFPNAAGETLQGFLHLPEGVGKVPGVIICHGFAKTKAQRKFVKLSRALAENSIASLRFDFSGHGDSEGEFEKLAIENQVEELQAAYTVLAQEERIDSERIAVLGHSLGALAAVLFQVKYKKVKALILLSPALHQRELIKEWYAKEEIDCWKKQGYLDTPKGRIGVQYLNGALSNDWPELVSQVQVPVLIVHGEEDKDVSLKYAQDLFQRFNNPKKLETIRGADHHFESKQAKEVLTKLSLAWLKKFL